MAGTAFACASPEKDLANLTEHKLSLRPRRSGLSGGSDPRVGLVAAWADRSFVSFCGCSGQMIIRKYLDTKIKAEPSDVSGKCR